MPSFSIGSAVHSPIPRFIGTWTGQERNGVGTKTYTSIADGVLVSTTTGRNTEGLNEHYEQLIAQIPKGVELPKDGELDEVWRVYGFTYIPGARYRIYGLVAEPMEMGTRVKLLDIREGTRIPFDILLERLSYAREWLQNSAHSFTVQLTGNVPDGLKTQRRIELRPWTVPTKNWLVQAEGRSDRAITIYDPKQAS